MNRSVDVSLAIAEQGVREIVAFWQLRFLTLIEEQLVVWLRGKAEAGAAMKGRCLP